MSKDHWLPFFGPLVLWPALPCWDISSLSSTVCKDWAYRTVFSSSSCLLFALAPASCVLGFGVGFRTEDSGLLELWVGSVWGGRWTCWSVAVAKQTCSSNLSTRLFLWVQPTHLNVCFSHRPLPRREFPPPPSWLCGAWSDASPRCSAMLKSTQSLPSLWKTCQRLHEQRKKIWWFLLTFGVDNIVHLAVLDISLKFNPRKTALLDDSC